MRYKNSDGIKSRETTSQQMRNNWDVYVRSLWMPVFSHCNSFPSGLLRAQLGSSLLVYSAPAFTFFSSPYTMNIALKCISAFSKGGLQSSKYS